MVVDFLCGTCEPACARSKMPAQQAKLGTNISSRLAAEYGGLSCTLGNVHTMEAHRHPHLLCYECSHHRPRFWHRLQGRRPPPGRNQKTGSTSDIAAALDPNERGQSAEVVSSRALGIVRPALNTIRCPASVAGTDGLTSHDICIYIPVHETP